MRKAITITLALCLTGCQNTYFNISTGPQIQPIAYGGSGWEGDGPIVDIEIERKMGEWFCKYAHTSNLFSGPPFNNKTETTLDRLTCGRSFRLH